MLETDHHLWTLSKGGPQSLGLSCDADGLFLGPTPLLQRSASRGFAPRPQAELERILARGFGVGVWLDRLMPGLVAVSSALNADNLCGARIAAVQLRIPDLPDVLTRLDMQLEDIQLSLDRVSKTTAAGDWDPAEHPRTGTPPNPGWFAPTGDDGEFDGALRPTLVSDNSNGGRLHLPSGDRNDEIGDLLEWIANAKLEDVQGINSEIDRLFYQVGDFQDANALHHALATVLANPDDATRQQVLEDYEPITHRDNPSAGADLTTDIALDALFGPALRPAERGASAAEAATEGAEASEEAASEVWKLGWAARGSQIEEALTADAPETRLPPNFPVIDQWADGVATSIKSIDLNAGTYQDATRLTYRINDYIGKLADFDGASFAGTTVENIEGRVLNIAIPKGSMTAVQKSAFDTAAHRAQEVGVILKITPF